MKIEKQVTSLKLSKKLKELGVKQESLFWWVNETLTIKQPSKEFKKASTSWYSAFTVTELGIKNRAITYGIRQDGICWARIDMSLLSDRKWSPKDSAKELFEAKSEANARAKMLIYL